MLRAYIKAIPGMTVEAQRVMADGDGVHKGARHIAKPGEGPAKLKEAKAAMRSGDLLWVADLTVLADNRDGLLKMLAELSAWKYPIGLHEGRTGRVSQAPHDGQHMAIEALARWSSANKKFGVLTAAEAGSEGGKVSAKRRRAQKLPSIKAKAMWVDPALWHLNTDEITAEINRVGREAGFSKTWSKDSLYRSFKKRGMPAGPKLKP